MLNDSVCVHLIDTPSFDDTSRSDVEVLRNIAVWFRDSWKHDMKLSGIIYLHRITDVRMAGSALRNLSMFKKLCGEKAYSSVVLATSMWNQVDEATGAQRERELIETKKFWGHMHEKGSRIFRLDRTRESCLEIIKYILSLGSTTLPELQDEVVNQGRQIEDIEAGMQLNDDIIRERKKHQAELLALKTQMQEKTAEHHAELQRVLKEYDELKENIRRSDEDHAKLQQDLKDVYESKERELLELKGRLGAERKKYDENQKRQATEHEASRQKLESLNERMLNTEEVNCKQGEALERRAQEDARRKKAWNEHQDTPLHLAALDGEADVAESLLLEGANIEAKNKYDETPLHLAAGNGKADVVKLLLDRGANTEAKNNISQTPLFDTISNGHADIAKLLLNRGANIDAAETSNNWTILHIMAAYGRADMAELLLDHGANIEAKLGNGCTPFGIAIEKGQPDMAKLLLDRGADIEAPQSIDDSRTALHVSADAEKNAKADMVKFLLDHGANIEAKINNSCTPFSLAIGRENKDVAKLLLDRGADINIKQRDSGSTALHITAGWGKVDMVNFLLDHGADIEAKINCGSTPLGYTIELGKMSTANLLLDRGANIQAQQRDDGHTILHLMAYFEKADMVDFLLDHGADIEAKTDYGSTPFGLAIEKKKKDVAKLLLDRGANIQAQQRDGGYTILHLTAEWGEADMINFLLDHGADTEAKTETGSTPLDRAKQFEKSDVVKLLLDQVARG